MSQYLTGSISDLTFTDLLFLSHTAAKYVCKKYEHVSFYHFKPNIEAINKNVQCQKSREEGRRTSKGM